MVRVVLRAEDLRGMEGGRFVRVWLPEGVWMPDGALATSVLVGRVDAGLRAYANVCRHHPLPLDYDAPSAMADDNKHLLCHQHGAVYRPSDGMCIDGPCKGAQLFAARVHEEEGPETTKEIVVFVDA
jgi:nitrite reductase/ring-hydroxylating ferredoxin subunit